MGNQIFTIGTGKNEFATFGHGVQAHKDKIKDLLGIQGAVSLWGDNGLAAQYAKYLDGQKPEAKTSAPDKTSIFQDMQEKLIAVPDATRVAPVMEKPLIKETEKTETPRAKLFPFEENGTPTKVHTTIPQGTTVPEGLIEHTAKIGTTEKTDLNIEDLLKQVDATDEKPEATQEEPKRKGFFGRLWDGLSNLTDKVTNFLKIGAPMHLLAGLNKLGITN